MAGRKLCKLELPTDFVKADANNTLSIVIAMPHSISPDTSPREDGNLPDAPSQSLENESAAESEDVPMDDAVEPSDVDKKGMVNLEDMFDNDDDDPESPSSSPPKIKEEASPSPEPVCVCVEQCTQSLC